VARQFYGNTTGDHTGTNWQAGWPKKTFQFVYDFSVLGGSAGSIPLTQLDGPLPDTLILQNAFIDVITPLGSAGLALAALTTGQGAGDLVVATAFSGAPFSSTGPKVTIPLLGTILTWVKMTGNRSPALVVSIADLSAGKFNLFCEGYVSS
jgi:hypothetical protein